MHRSSRLSLSVLFGFYVLLGFVDAAFGVAFASLLERHDLAAAELARAFIGGTAIALPCLWFGGKALRNRSKRPALLVVSVLVALLTWLLLYTSSASVFLVAIGCLALVTAGLDVVVGGAALDLEAREDRPVLGRVQAGFAVGAVVGAVTSGALMQGDGMLLMGAVVSIAGLLLAVGARVVPPPTLPGAVSSARKAARGASLAVIGFAALGAYYAEGLLQSWSALYLQRDLGASPLQAGLLSGGYYVAFGLGAVLSGTLLFRTGARRALRLLSGTAALGAVLLALSSGLLGATLGLLLLGGSVAGLMPTLLSWASRAGLASGAAGFVTSFAYAGMLLEPVAVSVSGDSLRPALLTLPILLLLIGAVTLRRPALPASAGAAPLGVAGD